MISLVYKPKRQETDDHLFRFFLKEMTHKIQN